MEKSEQLSYQAAGIQEPAGGRLFQLVKVKLSLLLLYDGKTAVFSGECGSFFTFWDKKQRGKMYVKNTDAGWRKSEQNK